MAVRRFRSRLTFQSRVVASDGYGNTQGAFDDEFTEWASVEPRLGGETILAGRLAGRNLVTIELRWSEQTAAITTEWRAVDARNTSKVYNIRSIIELREHRGRFREILAEEGVAT